MSFQAIFTMSGQSMEAQTVKLGLTAEALSHTNVAARSEAEVYQPRQALLASKALNLQVNGGSVQAFGVVIADLLHSQSAPVVRYQVGHPLADEEGRVYYPNISVVEEMAHTLSAAREFDAAVTVYSTGQRMHHKVLELVSV